MVKTEDKISLFGPTGNGGIERRLQDQRRGRVGDVDFYPSVCHALPLLTKGVAMVLILVRGLYWQHEQVTKRGETATGQQR